MFLIPASFSRPSAHKTHPARTRYVHASDSRSFQKRPPAPNLALRLQLLFPHRRQPRGALRRGGLRAVAVEGRAERLLQLRGGGRHRADRGVSRGERAASRERTTWGNCMGYMGLWGGKGGKRGGGKGGKGRGREGEGKGKGRGRGREGEGKGKGRGREGEGKGKGRGREGEGEGKGKGRGREGEGNGKGREGKGKGRGRGGGRPPF